MLCRCKRLISIGIATVYILILPLFFMALPETAFSEISSLEAIFINVGHGDAMVFKCEGESMMIDTGPTEAWKHIEDVLEDNGVDNLKYLLITHPHADHIGNVPCVLNLLNVETVILPAIEYATATYARTISSINEAGITTVYPCVGDVFILGGATVTVYAPHPVAYSNPNDWSIVLMVAYGSESLLLCADAEIASETNMLASNDDYPLKADVLKVGHHGSDTSSSYDFIKAVSPKIAIVSCDDDEYLDTDVAVTLFELDVEDVLTTAANGDIVIWIVQ